MIKVVLHVDSANINKVWRFDVSSIAAYTRKAVEKDVAQLFPDISRKGHNLLMWYCDELVREVTTIILLPLISGTIIKFVIGSD